MDFEIEYGVRLYKKIGTVVSPALFGQKIVFSDFGLNHLFRKRKRFRSMREQKKRFQFLLHVPEIIMAKHAVVVYNERTLTSRSRARYWVFLAKINGQNIKVVILQIDEGSLEFLSVMEDYKNQKILQSYNQANQGSRQSPLPVAPWTHPDYAARVDPLYLRERG